MRSQPYLAQSITSNDDFTAFTITLRPNIVFHDGTPLDGNALHTNIEKQATSVLTGPAFATNISGASVTGPLAVTITMKNPWAPFPYYLAQAQTGYVAAPSMLNSPNGTSNPVGTGPFVLQDWVPNSHMTATANPKYWRKGYPYLQSITYKPIIDPNSRADALQTGEIDIMHTELARRAAPVPGQQEVRLLRQQRPGGRPADHELRDVEHGGRAVQQRHRAQGHGHVRERTTVLEGDPTRASTRR